EFGEHHDLHSFPTRRSSDLLVNNVGAPCAGGAMALTEEQWDAQLDLNLKTVFVVSRCVLPVMKEKAAGAIVNIASTSGIRWTGRSEEHTSELQSRENLVCRL